MRRTRLWREPLADKLKILSVQMSPKTKTHPIISRLITESRHWHRLSFKTRLLIALTLLLLSYGFDYIYSPLASALTVWAILIFFEVLVQKYLFEDKVGKGNILDIQISAVLLGIIAILAPMFYFDSIYFLKISALDFASRYIGFLLPLSAISKSLTSQQKKGRGGGL